jgi:hypothetical protein
LPPAGSCTEATTKPTFDFKATFNSIPVITKSGQSPCTTNNYELPLNLGSFSIGAIEGGCPTGKGAALDINSNATIGKYAPGGKLKGTLTAKDDTGATMFSLELDVSL